MSKLSTFGQQIQPTCFLINKVIKSSLDIHRRFLIADPDGVVVEPGTGLVIIWEEHQRLADPVRQAVPVLTTGDPVVGWEVSI